MNNNNHPRVRFQLMLDASLLADAKETSVALGTSVSSIARLSLRNELQEIKDNAEYAKKLNDYYEDKKWGED